MIAPATIPTQNEFSASVLDGAQSARRSVEALAQILEGCPPEYKISAFLFLDLLTVARAHLADTVEGLQLLMAVPNGPSGSA